jgi:tetratricopeptide (TPR) repeat protein
MSNNKIIEADQLMQNGNIDKALQNYYDALFAMEPTAELFKKIAHCNKILGDNENAIEYYQKSLDIEKDNLEVLYNCGEAFQLNNQLDEAINFYNKVIEIATKTGGKIAEMSLQKKKEAQSTLLNRKGGAFMKDQNFDEAKQCFLDAIELNPKDRRNYMNIGVIYLKQGDTDQAIEWMKKTIAIDPKYIRCYFNLGTIYYNKNWYKKAMDIFEKALLLAPEDPDCSDIRKTLLVAQNEFENSQNELLKILEGDQFQISTENIALIAASMTGEDINSVDIVVQNNGKYQIIGYSNEKKFKLASDNGKLSINEIL